MRTEHREAGDLQTGHVADEARGDRAPLAVHVDPPAVGREDEAGPAALRALVEHHKHHSDGPLTAITDEIATLRAAVNTLAERVRSHEEQLRRLRN